MRRKGVAFFDGTIYMWSAAQGHPFMLLPTAGPYDASIPDEVTQNYLAFIDAGWEFGEGRR
jgi:hypothetical protein